MERARSSTLLPESEYTRDGAAPLIAKRDHLCRCDRPVLVSDEALGERCFKCSRRPARTVAR